MKSSHWSRFILKDCSPWEGSMLEQGIGDVKRKSRKELLWIDHNPPTSYNARKGEEIEWGMKA